VSASEDDRPKRSAGISELPADELITYGRELGLSLNTKMGRGELLRLIRERQELLAGLDRESLLEIVVWARRPVRQSASKEALVKEIASIAKMETGTLSHRALVALAVLRGVPAGREEPRELIEARLQANESLWNRVARKRRRVVGSLLTKLVNGSDEESQEYRFLPEDARFPSLRDEIEEQGVVGGIARRIRGVADDYVREKLDEIELRIDHKLDEIDRRLAEWRDREIANRLAIIKITLVASVLVALLSLGYSYIRTHW
jgi:hypothetical protein